MWKLGRGAWRSRPLQKKPSACARRQLAVSSASASALSLRQGARRLGGGWRRLPGRARQRPLQRRHPPTTSARAPAARPPGERGAAHDKERDVGQGVVALVQVVQVGVALPPHVGQRHAARRRRRAAALGVHGEVSAGAQRRQHAGHPLELRAVVSDDQLHGGGGAGAGVVAQQARQRQPGGQAAAHAALCCAAAAQQQRQQHEQRRGRGGGGRRSLGPAAAAVAAAGVRALQAAPQQRPHPRRACACLDQSAGAAGRGRGAAAGVARLDWLAVVAGRLAGPSTARGGGRGALDGAAPGRGGALAGGGAAARILRRDGRRLFTVASAGTRPCTFQRFQPRWQAHSSAAGTQTLHGITSPWPPRNGAPHTLPLRHRVQAES